MAEVVAVAYSGGRDSTALLHATACAARGSGVQVVALHVHHGLLPQADGWVVHTRQTCERWARDGLPVRWIVHHVQGAPEPGDSIEEWARNERYAALDRMAREAGASVLLLAHHGHDQAETFLLQALRGAGARGLSSMAREQVVDGLRLSRPWLDRPRQAIDAYLQAHALDAIEDPSNADVRFDRNRLRRDVWPALVRAFPDAQGALRASARWSQFATRVMDQVAAEDLARCQAPGAAGALQLALDRWLALSAERANLVLRAWLIEATGQVPASTLIERLCTELPGRGSARWPVPGGELRRFRRHLAFHPGAGVRTDAPSPPLPREVALRIGRAGRYTLPGWGGTLVATRVKEGGVPLAWLAHLELRERTGGERFQAGLGRPARSLKKQYQAAGVSEWERGRGPLVYSGGQLVFVPALGIDARVIGLPGQAQLSLHWETVRETG